MNSPGVKPDPFYKSTCIQVQVILWGLARVKIGYPRSDIESCKEEVYWKIVVCGNKSNARVCRLV